jgi:beta-galactosidase
MGSTVTTRGIYIRDTIRCYLPDQDITAPWWASRAEEWWTLCANQPWWMGGFIWTGFDYRGEPTPFTWPNINSHFGVMDMCGFPKNLYYYYKSWWSDQDVIHISPHWNATEKGKAGDTAEVWVNSNADEVELFLNEKSCGTRQMPRNGHLRWRLPYEPGTLKAVGTREGRTMESRVETTGIPVSLRLISDRRALKADGRDATVVNLQALDGDGREVPDAANLVTFTLTGSGRILGAGNGDPSSHEPDQTLTNQIARKMFNGKCQLIIQTGYEVGLVKVSASSEGIMTETISIPVIR